MKVRKMTSAALLGALLIGIVSCNKNDNEQQIPVQAAEITLQTSATLGSYLVDKSNRTLYFFSNDPNGQDSCTADARHTGQFSTSTI
jgi:predicted lipoprotein with Yx(FWY)xxD motif